VARSTARKAALRHLVDTFFDGSAASAVTALLGHDAGRLTDDELDRIDAVVRSARKETK
jgi:BlaI family penicillinase repressor